MANHAEQRPTDQQNAATGKQENLRKWIDALAKLAGAVAIAMVTYIVANLENTMSSINLLNQREQAETNLRASMFQTLIDPVLGPTSDNAEPQLPRQRLLVELLALNFHDHIEFKPLLLDVDRKLAEAGDEEDRRSLRSVARRVIDRQVNSLDASAQSLGLPRVEPVEVYLEFPFESEKCIYRTSEIRPGCREATKLDKARIGEDTCHVTGDGKYELRISVSELNICQAAVNVGLQVFERDSGELLDTSSFTLTHFDFPLTDNARIDPDHRYSVALYDLVREVDSGSQADPPKGHAELRLVWFPKGYITPQERPVDYLTLRKSLGLDQ